MLALRLYRRIMKLHMRNMPMELRYFGDLYVKQEFRLHLDTATEEQMDKFMVAWNAYAKQIEGVKRDQPQQLKKTLMNPDLDVMLKDKLSSEQFSTMHDFKELIYESEKMKQEKTK